MSVTGRVAIGIPLVLLYEGEGYTVTIETKKGEQYRGLLVQAEDNMNMYLKNVSYTSSTGETTKMEQVYLRGTVVKFIVFPQILQRGPMFKRVKAFKEKRFVPQGASMLARTGR